MNTRLLLRTLVAAGVVAALALPGSAMAQTRTHHDAAHDVQRYDVVSGKITTARHNKSVDVVRARLSYSRPSLTSTVWLRSGKVGHHWLMSGKIRTGSKPFAWDASQDGTSKTLILRNGSTGAEIACKGLALQVKRAKGRVTVTVPSRCLGKPHALREGILFGAWSSDTVACYDDAFQKRGYNTNGVLALSHKLHRG